MSNRDDISVSLEGDAVDYFAKVIMTLLLVLGILCGMYFVYESKSEARYYECLYKMQSNDKYDAGDVRMLCKYGKTRESNKKSSTTTTVTVDPGKKEKT